MSPFPRRGALALMYWCGSIDSAEISLPRARIPFYDVRVTVDLHDIHWTIKTAIPVMSVPNRSAKYHQREYVEITCG